MPMKRKILHKLLLKFFGNAFSFFAADVAPYDIIKTLEERWQIVRCSDQLACEPVMIVISGQVRASKVIEFAKAKRVNGRGKAV